MADEALPRPLANIRVLDLSRVMAGPMCAQILGDLGADVIKIERPGRGDDSRSFGPPFFKDGDGNNTRETPMFIASNRNKRSVTINLSSPRGQDLVRDLVRKADVLVENYKVDDLARYGLGYDDLKAINPNLVYCSVTGFGQTGPLRHRLGYDSIFQAMGGLMGTTGYPEADAGGGPVKVGVVAADIIGGLFATIGVLGALMARQQGENAGQHIDIGLLDGVVAAMSHMATNYLISGNVPKLRGTMGSGGMPSKMFRCQDGQVMIVAGNDEQYRRLCRAVGHEELADDPRFATNSMRVQNNTLLSTTLDDILCTWDADELVQALDAASVPAAKVNNLQEVFEEDQVRERGMLTKAPHASGVDTPLLRSPIRYSRTPMDEYTAPPTLGQHNNDVLTSVLGLAPAEIQALANDGII